MSAWSASQRSSKPTPSFEWAGERGWTMPRSTVLRGALVALVVLTALVVLRFQVLKKGGGARTAAVDQRRALLKVGFLPVT